MRSQQEILEIAREMAEKIEIIFPHANMKAILFGSYARRNADDESDIDVMALVDMDKNELAAYRRRISNFSCELDMKYDVVLSVKLQDKATFDRWSAVLPFFQNVKRDGVLVNG